MGCVNFNLKPPVILESGLSSCKCGKQDLKGIVRKLGRCLDCAARDLTTLATVARLVKQINVGIGVVDTHVGTGEPNFQAYIPCDVWCELESVL